MVKVLYHWFLRWILCCTTLTTYTISLPEKQWHRDHILSFYLSIPDTTHPYDVLLFVRSTEDYPYQNMYIAHTIKGITQRTCHKTLQSYQLFHEKTGKPLGDGWGRVKCSQLTLVQNHTFDQVGTYQLTLEQFMRKKRLPGVVSLCIQVIPKA